MAKKSLGFILLLALSFSSKNLLAEEVVNAKKETGYLKPVLIGTVAGVVGASIGCTGAAYVFKKQILAETDRIESEIKEQILAAKKITVEQIIDGVFDSLESGADFIDNPDVDTATNALTYLTQKINTLMDKLGDGFESGTERKVKFVKDFLENLLKEDNEELGNEFFALNQRIQSWKGQPIADEFINSLKADEEIKTLLENVINTFGLK